MALYPTPGLSLFTDTGESAVLGEFYFNGRAFAAGNTLWEVFADKSKTGRGNLGTVTDPVTFAANQANQILVCAGGNLYVFDLSTNILTLVDMTQLVGPVSMVGFADGYFVALIKDSNKFQLSGLLDGTTWSGLDVNEISVFSENIVSMAVVLREVVFQGAKQSAVYQNTGASSTPFLPAPGGFCEQGSGAAFGTIVMDNSYFWLGEDTRGGRMAWRANGYTPARVSDHGCENAWRQYSTISDAVSWSYQENGHTFWVIYFPTADATWVYDAATQMWHERASLDGSAHKARCHMFAFGKHLVGDRASGKIYEMSSDILDDAGTAIRRVRRAPHLSREMKQVRHYKLQLDVESGLGPQPPLRDGNGDPRGPEMTMRFSDDGAHTWSNEFTRDCGQAGKFSTRVIWNRLGQSRDRVYEISVSDPIPWRIVDAYLETN